MKGYKSPPLVPTDFTPRQILGNLWEPFCGWIVQREFSNTAVKLKDADAARMGGCIDRLAAHGFVVGTPNSNAKVDANGNVMFSIICCSPTQQIFAGPELEALKKLPTDVHVKAAKGAKSGNFFSGIGGE